MGGKEKLNKNVVEFDGLVTVLYHVANPSDVSGEHFVSSTLYGRLLLLLTMTDLS